MKRRRRSRILLMASLLSLVVAACSGDGGGDEEEGETGPATGDIEEVTWALPDLGDVLLVPHDWTTYAGAISFNLGNAERTRAEVLGREPSFVDASGVHGTAGGVFIRVQAKGGDEPSHAQVLDPTSEAPNPLDEPDQDPRSVGERQGGVADDLRTQERDAPAIPAHGSLENGRAGSRALG